jgi:hypothetical protein
MPSKRKIVVAGFSFMLAMVAGGSSLAVAAPQAVKATGMLVVNATPRGAGVFVGKDKDNMEYLGPASAGPFTVNAGDEEVRVEDPRYEVFTQKIGIQAGGNNTVTATLKPLAVPAPPFGTLQVTCPDKYAAVKLNGQYVAYRGEINGFFRAGLLVKPGEYTVSIEPLSDIPHATKVTIQAGKRVAVGY